MRNSRPFWLVASHSDSQVSLLLQYPRDIGKAKMLGNMGFKLQGENLSLIIVEADKGKNAGHYIIETRIDQSINKNLISLITWVSHKSAAWNVKMTAMIAILCAFSITPFIYLNQGATYLKKSTTWVFPVLRATNPPAIQLLIQRRITTISHYLVKRDQLPNLGVEVAVEPCDGKKYQMYAHTLVLLYLLIGLVTSVVGYIGCFSVVKKSTSTLGPVSWLCLEAGLSVIRLAIYDAPPLEIILKLDEHQPFPTCNKYNEEILENKVLPFTRTREFLKIITSFAGLIEPFSNSELSLY